jgi:hypothetical protein
LLSLDQKLGEKCDSQMSLLVLSTDVIRYVVFRPHDWQNLEFLEYADDPLLVTYKAAVDFIENAADIESLQTAACAAYVLEFTHHMSKKIAYDHAKGCFSSHALVYQIVNSILDNADARFSLLLLKDLAAGKGLRICATLARLCQGRLAIFNEMQTPRQRLAY